MMTRPSLKVFIMSIFFVVVLLLMTTPAAAAPAQGPTYTTVHVVRPGETLYSIARAYGVSVYDLSQANYLVNPNQIYAGQSLVVPRSYGYVPPYSAGSTYVVQPGDTLYSIAMRHGTTVGAIAQANNLSSADLIYAGQRLVIPSGASSAPVVVERVVVVEKTPPPEPLKPAVCNELTRITFPRQGETLDGVGTFSIQGTAAIKDFQFYKLELGVGEAPIEFHSIDEVQTKPIVNGILLRDWNTGALPEGTYILRLTVVDKSGQFPPPCDVLVHIDH